MRRYIVVQANGSYTDYPDIEFCGSFDSWLFSVKMARREGVMIIDTQTGKNFEDHDKEVIKTKKDFAWYMNSVVCTDESWECWTCETETVHPISTERARCETCQRFFDFDDLECYNSPNSEE